MLTFLRKSLLILAATVGLAGCGSEEEFTANVEGSYTVSLTNRENDCMLGNWSEDGNPENIPLTMSQEGSHLHGVIEGIWGALVMAWLGSPEFDGSVARDTFTLTNHGTNLTGAGTCMFKLDATLDGKLADDAISGTLTYSPASDSPDCIDARCNSVQEFSGSRPPM